MAKWTCGAILAVSLTLIGIALAQDAGKEPKHIKAKDAKYTEVIPGVSKAPLWGDDKTGPYGSFTKFAPGHKNPLHTHSSELHIVVLEGAYIYDTGSGEKRVEAGEYCSIPAGMPHSSGGDADKGALFYEASGGKFDLNLVEKK